MACNRVLCALIIYLSFLLDNMLLTVIVPILPDYLAQLKAMSPPINGRNLAFHLVSGILGKHPLAGNAVTNTTTAEISTDKLNVIGSIVNDVHFEAESSSIGVLLAIKSVVQLIFNPIVGNLSAKFGYRLLIICGTVILLGVAIVFGVAKSYVVLFIARAVQGVGSACIGVCGMSLVAQLYAEERQRSNVMGIILGSVALGVLLGYPLGGVLYDFMGKSSPFFLLAFLIFALIVFQLVFFKLSLESEANADKCQQSTWFTLLQDSQVLIVIFAIFLSTFPMAVLESCLPIWLMEKLHPKKWQLGTVFIPDSLGYLIGTNFFGGFAFIVGQIKLAVFALLVVGVSCLLIPCATSFLQLMVPHFALGLGIGSVDAALVPLLASVIDSKFSATEFNLNESPSNYGAIYAIQQMAVSLAYCLGPLFGGELSDLFGFGWLMIFIGCTIIVYGIALFVISTRLKLLISVTKAEDCKLTDCHNKLPTKYARLYNTID